MSFLPIPNTAHPSWPRPNRLAGFAALACYVLAPPTVAAQSQGAKQHTPVATVDGHILYEEDLLPSIQGQLTALHNQEYEAKKKALDDLIQQKLLEAAAKKKGVTTEQLLAQEVDAKVAEPSDAEVQGYYIAVRDRINTPLADVKPQLHHWLKQATIQQARQDYIKSLRTASNVVLLLSPPRLTVGYDPARLRGNPNAPVMIVEFSDYQCPYCHQVEPAIEAIRAKYGEKVSFAYRDFPLRSIHANAEIAAEASRCALEQDKYWEYHDRLFKASNLDKESLIGYAKDTKLDEKQFESCLTSEKYKSQIDKDIDEGRRAGVNGTPAFIINGIFTSGAQPQDVLTRIIDDELSKNPTMRASSR